MGVPAKFPLNRYPIFFHLDEIDSRLRALLEVPLLLQSPDSTHISHFD